MVYSWILCVDDERIMYTELQITTNFDFLRGASHPEELVEQAAKYGIQMRYI